MCSIGFKTVLQTGQTLRPNQNQNLNFSKQSIWFNFNKNIKYYNIKELTSRVYNLIIIKINRRGEDLTSVSSAILMNLEPGTTDPVEVELAI